MVEKNTTLDNVCNVQFSVSLAKFETSSRKTISPTVDQIRDKVCKDKFIWSLHKSITVPGKITSPKWQNLRRQMKAKIESPKACKIHNDRKDYFSHCLEQNRT